MRKKLVVVMSKIYRKTLYRILMFIFGFPTFLLSLVLYQSDKSKHKVDDIGLRIRKQVCADIEKDGSKQTLYDETKLHLKNKHNFFKQTITDKELEKETDEQFALDLEDLIQKRLDENEEYRNSVRNEGFFDYVMRMVETNNAFLIFSAISSFPMYILFAIYANPYAKYIFERLMMMVFVLFGVVFLVFTILYMSPMDPAVNILGQGATPEQVETFNHVYGLDQPYIVRLFQNFKGLATFNLGNSYAGNEVVAEAIARKFPVTLQLTFVSLAVAILIAVPAGIVSAIKQYSSFDNILMLLALLGLSIPNFWLGLILILNFSINMNILPATFAQGNWRSLIMPAIVLGTSLAASVARMTRSSMLEVIKSDYIVTARAKGLSRRKVILKHALGNAMIPIVTVIGLQFGDMLGGAAVTEKVFNIIGIGSYIVDKQFIPDIPVVLSGVVYVAVVISLVNLFVDILYAFLDPRIKSNMKKY